MNADPWQREFDAALRAFLKADRSPVTAADFAVLVLVAHRLREMFPDDPLVEEEDAATLRSPAGRAILQAVLGA
jgi:3'-phosphoadenosine 5'-phosphosulfate (PAPS) 3'-phosphatase